jgi:error-prone DNA polymerase
MAQPYRSLRDVWLRAEVSARAIERLADADAFGSLGLKRRDALWAAKALGRVGDQDELPLFAGNTHPYPSSSPGRCEAASPGDPDKLATPSPLDRDCRDKPGNDGDRHHEPPVALPPMPLGEEVVNDYRFLHLSLRAHPVSFLRDELTSRRILRNQVLRETASGTIVTVAGLITCRQRPGSAQGVVFMTIEDETALANIIVWPKVFEKFRPIVLGARLIAARGPLQQESGVIHVVANRLEDLTPLLARLAEEGESVDGLARCDEVKNPVTELREQRLNSNRASRLEKLLDEMPELAADLDVPARGSAHSPRRHSQPKTHIRPAK